MHFTLLNEKDFFNPYYRKKQIIQNEFDIFNKALMQYLERLESSQSENEDYLVANALSPFLTMLNFKTHIKTKQKGKSEIDLSISKDEFSKDLEVLIEAKKPNSKEFITHTKVNSKALHETILYYFRNREYSFSLKFIIITDFYKFYIFKISEFEELFYKNPSFKKLFEEFCNPNSLFKGNTEEFYKEVAKLIENSKENLKGFLIDLTFLKDKQKSNFKNLASIYKTFHRDFLLSEFNPNDANSLNNAFYKELLYILGLCESKQNSKLIIAKSEESKEEQGTFYTAINSKLKEENFETILKLLILWLNRILFLKLIESNLVRFNDDKNLKFLNFKKIPDFDKLSELFFEVLAKEKSTRKKSEFAYLPYLNSSLFEKQSIENTLEISSLSNDLKLFYYKNTVLKDDKCKAKKGQVGLLEYLFEFLDSFDFGSDDEQSEILSQKELISSSVLGNVFEKLNGYKEGSFYTPSFITSYMCKESITKVVLDKFNAQFDLDAKDISELRKSLRKEDKKAQKELLNSIKICDPAVGSGHFLVSALNVMLSIYDELNLFDEEFYLEVQNDEILITGRKGEFIEYKRPSTPKDKAHLIQQELFHTKKDIIENNLFGVDINPNSCEITKLRLWIELLKHSFYQSFDDENYHDLKTLPNIDINIKCGNSLVSYFETGKSLNHYPNIKERINKYKRIVKDYKEGFYTDKSHINQEIKNLKISFKNFCFADKFKKEMKGFNDKCEKYSKKYGNFLAVDDENLKFFVSANLTLFDFDEKEATKEFANLKKEYDNIFNLESNHPFEWRFEFPEILDDDGNFKGFDLIIGNPPYIRIQGLDKNSSQYYKKHFKVASKNYDIYILFIEQCFKLIKKQGVISFIMPHKWFNADFGVNLREFAKDKISKIISFEEFQIFDASTYTALQWFENNSLHLKFIQADKNIKTKEEMSNFIFNLKEENFKMINNKKLSSSFWSFEENSNQEIFSKINQHISVKDIFSKIFQGLATSKDSVYFLKDCQENKNSVKGYSKELDKEVEIEKEILKPLLMGDSFHRYEKPISNSMVLFPYYRQDNTDVKKMCLYDENELKSKFPKAWEYLKECESILRARENGRLSSDDLWWRYIYPKNQTLFNKEKLLCPDICNNTHFVLDNLGEFYFTTTIYGYVRNEEYKNLDYKYLMAVLNSSLTWWFLQKTSVVMRGGFYRIKPAYIEKFCIPKINSKNQKIADELINSVDEILKAKEQDKNANTQELENKINSLVYKLYNLTEEEIKIIEGK
ncbi:class I SAM-dependent DNA methyltransferase [Campylobacter jejuni]|uniref:site-specific DNA-methyltransferase (adenine-specific) n=5 Tax=Campylobacter jejuni TaxID=197 RepID=A0A5Z1PL05_CAMJU|nr:MULTISPECIES: Eco57I restriction-modification methylase domain-containing protein [Campylobacter]AZN10098.1 class I SAM-dependent DNA methyltransferase [Campylobacter jejuni subsp. jejuni]EAH4892343.1 class I SAM-dependent DNA methyltransferase [Campylobacter jejuni]EAH5132506.1 class I SAM-dependent DNA methyltransferase [Campylobacter jejuni]EAH5190369.1 class I SAM-dependent DNA methyltransferase [Campylobacter jejuni]EAH5726597.1 class I SAM-dependent DNA methyltransferase [Campylobacte